MPKKLSQQEAFSAGTEYQFKFARDDEGKITKCTASVPAMGLEIEGVKIKE